MLRKNVIAFELFHLRLCDMPYNVASYVVDYGKPLFMVLLLLFLLGVD